MSKMLVIERCSGCPYDEWKNIDEVGRPGSFCVYSGEPMRIDDSTTGHPRIPDWCPLPDYHAPKGEILGNIYEHPDLLKEAK